MYIQHTRGMATTRHRSLVERGGRKALSETLHTHTHTKNTKKKCEKKPIFTNLKKRFEHIELPAKLLDYFLRSNKSNINQSERIGDIPAPKGHNDQQKEPVRGRDRDRERQFVGVSLRTGFPAKISALLQNCDSCLEEGQCNHRISESVILEALWRENLP